MERIVFVELQESNPCAQQDIARALAFLDEHNIQRKEGVYTSAIYHVARAGNRIVGVGSLLLKPTQEYQHKLCVSTHVQPSNIGVFGALAVDKAYRKDKVQPAISGTLIDRRITSAWHAGLELIIVQARHSKLGEPSSQPIYRHDPRFSEVVSHLGSRGYNTTVYYTTPALCGHGHNPSTEAAVEQGA